MSEFWQDTPAFNIGECMKFGRKFAPRVSDELKRLDIEHELISETHPDAAERIVLRAYTNGSSHVHEIKLDFRHHPRYITAFIKAALSTLERGRRIYVQIWTTCGDLSRVAYQTALAIKRLVDRPHTFSPEPYDVLGVRVQVNPTGTESHMKSFPILDTISNELRRLSRNHHVADELRGRIRHALETRVRRQPPAVRAANNYARSGYRGW